jgi:S-DNA-T family DNA segregation ATPase FtsK/SpoIIIE
MPLVSLDAAEPPAPGEEFSAALIGLGVPGTVEAMTVGPVVTQYVVRHDPRVRVRVMRTTCEDLALRLGVRFVTMSRDGKTVRYDVTNHERVTVPLAVSQVSDEKVPLVVGLAANGNYVVRDLSEAPHALVAGSTGAGKSVFINALISGILHTRTPEQIRFFLIDPKQVEFSRYEGMPHLKMPVLSSVMAARNALEGLVLDMENRYTILRQAGCRDIGEYERKGWLVERWVVIIDEWADLYKQDKAIQDPVIRLTAKARAAGIHMVLATQNPKAEILNTLVKNNFPTRIAFQVPTDTASRVILDENGAEKLLRKGDMLYKDADGMFRAQGPWVSEGDLDEVVDHWRSL